MLNEILEMTEMEMIGAIETLMQILVHNFNVLAELNMLEKIKRK